MTTCVERERFIQEAIEEVRCPNCYGSGKCNDADLGDTTYNEWTCQACNGTGYKQQLEKQ